MKQFYYKASNDKGEKVQGLVEAKDEKAAVQVLRGKGLMVINLSDQQRSLSYQFYINFLKISLSEVVYFTRQFATMINAGLPMVNSLQLLRSKSKPAMAKVIDEISSSIEGGDSLHKAMSDHPAVFSPVYLALVKAGELGGVLDQVMEQLARNMEKQREFMAKVKGAMLYPAIVMLAMVAIGLIMVFVVMPKLQDLYKEFDAKLPLITSVVLGSAEFIRNYFFIFIGVFVGLVVAIISWLKSPTGKQKFDAYILRIPYLGELQHKVISTNVTRTLALLIKSGVSIVESLSVVSLAADNAVYKTGIEQAAKSVEKGIPLAASFSQAGFLPDVVIQMISVGEETGKLDTMLAKIAKQFEKDSIIALKALTSAIEPAMIIILGVGVGVMVFAIIVPIYSLTSQF